MAFHLVPLRRLFTSLRKFNTRMASNLIKVQVKQGVIVGQQRKLPNGGIYNSFQGVPYAVPPIGDLRFKSPVPLERFESPEINCTKEGDISHQRNPFKPEVIGSENCLFLNVYAPKITKSQSPLPVMVFIHGGGFMFGSGNSDYYLPLGLMQENVIVVTLNYRLGVLGFLALPEEQIWGNAGLKDQRLALQWVHDNIHHFNGDANNVTLFGESAGASSIHLHAYARHANKLFHKVIMQSGTANMEWVFQVNPAYKTRRLAELLGLKSTDTKEILNFLQSPSITALALLTKAHSVLTEDERRRGLPMPFRLMIEDTESPDKIIDRPVLELLQTPNTMHLPTIMGYNSGEGMALMMNAMRKYDQIDKDLARFVPRNIPLSLDDETIHVLTKQMRELYFKGRSITPELFDGLSDLLGDYHFIVDMQKAAAWQAKLQPNAPLYFYRFDYTGGRNMYKRIFEVEKLTGACHGDELFYLFQGADDHVTPLSDQDARMVQQLCGMWANFSRCGNPTPPDREAIISCSWQPVMRPSNEDDTFSLNYLSIDNKNCQMKCNPDAERIQFWRNIYRTYPADDYSLLSVKVQY